jgi:hypothetical protein
MSMNPLINIDGDTASGSWYFLLTFAMTDGSSGWSQGWYDEQYITVGGQWLFDRVDVSFGGSSAFERNQSIG